MIIDLPRFIAHERPVWSELESILDKLDDDATHRLTLESATRFHFLYEKVAADLARLNTFGTEPETRRYLESLVARAYGEIHETRESVRRVSLWRWFLVRFPQTFRRHIHAFWLSFGVTIAGIVFGGFSVLLDAEAKEIIFPSQFSHLLQDPARRVAEEEKAKKERRSDEHASFASFLMANNISVSIRTLAAGITWGIGTIILLFYNGVLLGAVLFDYMRAGQTAFVLGWLMPHGVIEIPSVLIAGQAGFVLGNALIGWGDRTPLKVRLRLVGIDLISLISGVALMLVWAGLVESFLSQIHQPAIPYLLKIAFGVAELGALIWFLGWGFSPREPRERAFQR